MRLKRCNIQGHEVKLIESTSRKLWIDSIELTKNVRTAIWKEKEVPLVTKVSFENTNI